MDGFAERPLLSRWFIVCSTSWTSLGRIDIIISSAKTSSFPFSIISNVFEFLDFRMKSRTILKNIGLRTPPCGVPFAIFTVSSQSSYIPVTSVRNYAEKAQSFWYFQRFVDLIFLMALSIMCRGILSKAPAMPREKIICLFLFLFFFFITIIFWLLLSLLI